MQGIQRIKAIVIAALVLTVSSAHAISVWTASSCVTNCSETGDAAPNVSFSAYSAAINTSGGAYSSTQGFAQSTLAFYSGDGFGVTAPSGDSQTPNQTMDNYGYEDLIVFVFDDPVTLTQLEIGLWQYDSDITVLAYTGSTAGITPDSTIAGHTAATLRSVNGWSLIGSYADVVAGASTPINAMNVSSSWWIISAYNSQFGGAPTGADGSTAGLTRGLGTAFTAYDFVELFSVSGSAVHAGAVPEPATLALVGIALAISGVARRPRSPRQR